MDVKNKGVSSFRFEHRTVHKDGAIVWAKTFFTVVKNGVGDNGPAFIAGVVENITEQRRLALEMTELKDRLQNSMELERLRLAQELHDNPMQVLYSASYRLEELRTKVDPELSESLKGVKDIIQTVLHDLRATAKELRPPTILVSVLRMPSVRMPMMFRKSTRISSSISRWRMTVRACRTICAWHYFGFCSRRWPT